MIWILLFIFWTTCPMQQEIEKYNLQRLEQERESPDLIERLQDRARKVGASTEVFIDYIHDHNLFTHDDAELLPDILRSIRREDYDVYDKISRVVLEEWRRNNSESTSSDDHEPHLDAFLLARIKNEQQQRMLQMQQQHEHLMNQQRFTQRKFYISSLAAVITTLISVVQAYFLSKKESDG